MEAYLGRQAVHFISSVEVSRAVRVTVSVPSSVVFGAVTVMQPHRCWFCNVRRTACELGLSGVFEIRLRRCLSARSLEAGMRLSQSLTAGGPRWPQPPAPCWPFGAGRTPRLQPDPAVNKVLLGPGRARS